jgi:hypothetical protein
VKCAVEGRGGVEDIFELFARLPELVTPLKTVRAVLGRGVGPALWCVVAHTFFLCRSPRHHFLHCYGVDTLMQASQSYAMEGMACNQQGLENWREKGDKSNRDGAGAKRFTRDACGGGGWHATPQRHGSGRSSQHGLRA